MRRPRFIGHHVAGGRRSGSSVIKDVKVAADEATEPMNLYRDTQRNTTYPVQREQSTAYVTRCISATEYKTNLCTFLDRSRKLKLTTVGDAPRWLRDTPLSTKVGTKFRRQVVVAQSV
jgi:hypothetical protein